MYKFEFAERVILLAWRDGVPYAGYLDVLGRELKSQDCETEGCIERTYELKLSNTIKFERNYLEGELRYVRSEIRDINEMDKFTLRDTAECRVILLTESGACRASITGEFGMYLNIWQVSARITVKAISEMNQYK